MQYSYDDRSVVVVNSYYRSFPKHKVTAKVYNLDLAEKFSKAAPVDIGADSATRVFEIPEIAGLSRTYFVRLSLQDERGKQVSSNFYWLSTQPDVSDWAGSNGRYTPIKTFADLTALESLPVAKLRLTSRTELKGTEQIERVTVENPTSQLAFSVHLRVLKGKGGKEVVPILWGDNYFELMPGEKREITATYQRKLLGGTKSWIALDGWNVATGSE